MSTIEKKVAIVGKASNSLMLAPFEDKKWEIWGLSNTYVDIPRWDVWFELHDWEYHRINNMEHYQWLMNDHKKPIFAFKHQYHDAPSAIEYPIDKVLEMFGNHFNGKNQFRYWTNSPSYMMALAMLQGATTIGLWGIDMAMVEEYSEQRPSCELMIGACLAKGINVVIPDESSLCKCRRLYGYETHNDDGYVEVRTRENNLKQRLTEANQTSAELSNHRSIFIGALQEVEQFEKSNDNYKPEERKKVISEAIETVDVKFQEIEKQKYIFQGALEDLTWVRTVFLT